MNTDKVNVKFCPLGNFIKLYVIEATRLAPWELFTTSYLLLSQSLEVMKTRSSWLNCALRDDEAVFWASIGHYEAVAVGN